MTPKETSKPHNDLIISYNADGSPCSKFSDNTWDVSFLTGNEGKKKLLIFEISNLTTSPAKSEQITREIKTILYIAIFENQKSVAPGTLQNYVKTLKSIARFALKGERTVYDVFSDLELTKKYYASEKFSLAKNFKPLLEIILLVDDEILGINPIDRSIATSLKRMHAQRKEDQQTSPIPTKIYLNILSYLDQYISDVTGVLPFFLGILRDCLNSPLLGRNISHQYTEAKKLGIKNPTSKLQPTITELIDDPNFKSFCYKYDLKINDLKDVSSFITEIQITCKTQIHVFSGMRDDEARSLEFNCIESVTANGKSRILINGFSTKFNNGKRIPSTWVTCDAGKQAIICAQKVAELIYSGLGIDDKELKSKRQNYPLFVSPTYLPFVKAKTLEDGENIETATLDLYKSRFLSRIDMTISEESLEELEFIDLDRAWRTEEDFSIGQQWRLTTHQFRRSLALYASRSGLVSLPALRHQLRHITNEMSLYYSKGASFAKNILDLDSVHFSGAYQLAQIESAHLAYVKNVLGSDKRLFGAHGRKVERNKEKNMTEISLDRKKTLSTFKKGLIAYTDTPFGGCTEVSPCEKKATYSLTSCIGCDKSVITSDKLDYVIQTQKDLVSSLNKDTFAWKKESKDLELLIMARKKMDEDDDE